MAAFVLTFVCAPQPVQWAGVLACDIEFPERVAEYRLNRDFLVHELGNLYEFAPADGAFYLFAKAPWGTGGEFVAEAIKNDLLIIPGNVFSDRDTHFRISYAGEHRTLADSPAFKQCMSSRGYRFQTVRNVQTIPTPHVPPGAIGTYTYNDISVGRTVMLGL